MTDLKDRIPWDTSCTFFSFINVEYILAFAATGSKAEDPMTGDNGWRIVGSRSCCEWTCLSSKKIQKSLPLYLNAGYVK